MTKNLAPVLVFLLLSIPHPTYAHTVLTEEDAVAFALRNNYEILSAEEEISSAGARLGQIKSGFFPQIEAAGYYSRYVDHPTMPFDDNMGYRFTLSQTLFTGGKLSGSYRSAQLGLEAAEYSREEVENRVRYTVKNGFYGAVLAEEFLRINSEALHLAEKMLESVVKRFERGEASHYELLRCRVEAANIRSEFITAGNRVRASKNSLKLLLGMDPDKNIVLKGALEFSPAEFDAEELTRLALANRPQLKELSSLLESARLGVKAARAGYMPSIVLNVANIANQREPFTQQRGSYEDYWEATVGVAVPVFDGGLRRSRVLEARAAERSIAHLETQARAGVRVEVENAVLDIRSARERVGFQKENVETAREAYNIVNERYALGAATHLEVLDARLALSTAQVNYAAGLRDYMAAGAKLEFVIGEAPVDKD